MLQAANSFKIVFYKKKANIQTATGNRKPNSIVSLQSFSQRSMERAITVAVYFSRNEYLSMHNVLFMANSSLSGRKIDILEAAALGNNCGSAGCFSQETAAVPSDF